MAATSGSVAQNASLFTLMDFSKVRVQVPVPEIEVPFIKNGLPVKVTVEELPTAAFEGSITRYSYALDDATKTMLVEIELANPEKQLHPGMYARIRIIVERKPDALIIPTDALVQVQRIDAAVRQHPQQVAIANIACSQPVRPHISHDRLHPPRCATAKLHRILHSGEWSTLAG